MRLSNQPPFVPFLGTAASVLALSLAGCQSMANLDTASLTQAGGTALQAFTLTDGQITTMSAESCAAMDQKNQVAEPSSPYTARLDRVVAQMPQQINGQPAVYKVYITKDVNAWAMANGCIRVYSGLMDVMNDDELRGVIGHEIGHVALGHSKARMQVAAATSAVRTAAASTGNATVTALTQSQAGDLAEKFVGAQFSQRQESAADDYSFDLLTRQKLDRQGLVTAFQKLAAMDAGQGGISLLASHPPSAERAAHIQKRLDSQG